MHGCAIADATIPCVKDMANFLDFGKSGLMQACFAPATLWVLFVVASFGGGCGEAEPKDDENFCGENTTFVDGQCVPQDHDCPDGEMVSPRGECEDPDAFCGPDATYDVESQRCVPVEELQCGQGTVAQDGVCVMDGAHQCGVGTLLSQGVCVLKEDVCGEDTSPVGDEAVTGCELADDACQGGAQLDIDTGRCVVVDSVVCGEGTTEWEGACLPYRTVADELAKEATLSHGDDVPIVASTDGPVIFTGTMDEELTHHFNFIATGDDWVEVTLYSRGLPSPAFSIADGQGWRRATVAGLHSTPSRLFGIPESGSYDFYVTTTLSQSDNSTDFGDETWEYVGVVEVVSPPSATSWDALFEEPIGGDLRETASNFVSVDLVDSESLLVTAQQIGAHVEGAVVELWSDTGQLQAMGAVEQGRSVLFDTSAVSSATLHFDAALFLGTKTDFEFRARGPETLLPGESYEETVSAEAGDLILMSHRSDEAKPVDIAVVLDGQLQYELAEVFAQNQFGALDSDETMRPFFYAPEDGEYVLEFHNTSDTTLHHFAGIGEVDTAPTYELAAGESSTFETHIPAEGLANGDWRFVIIDAPTAALLDGEIAAGEGSPAVSLFDSQGGLIDSRSAYSQVNGFEFVLESSGIYILAIRPHVDPSPLVDMPPISGGIDVGLQGRSVSALYPGEVHSESWIASTEDLLMGTVTFESGGPVDLRLVGPEGDLIFEKLDVGSGFDLVEILPESGEFTLEVECASATLGLDVDAEVVTHAEYFNAVDGFEDTYDRPEMDPGDGEFYVILAQTDFQLDVEALVGEDEAMLLRLWDVDERQLMHEVQGESEVPFVEPRLSAGLYVLEAQAVTPLQAPWQLNLAGSLVEFIDVVHYEDPPVSLETYDGVGQSELTVSGCSEIADVWISVDFQSADDEFLSVDLVAPPMDEGEALALREAGVAAPKTTVFGDDTPPVDSLDVLVGEFGDGVWELIVTNDSCCVEAELLSWGVHLSCL